MKTEEALEKRARMMESLGDHPEGPERDAAWAKIVAFSKEHDLLDVPISTEGCVHAVICEDGMIGMVVRPPEDIPEMKPHYGPAEEPEDEL